MPIHYEQLDGHVARITIDRPEARNSLDLHHFRDLAEAWRRFRDDVDDWVAIVTGVPGQFMTGADLKTYIPQITELQQQIQAGDVEEIDGCRLRDGTDAVLRSLKIYKPIIAAVDGPCVAGGMEMLGGIDIRIPPGWIVENEAWPILGGIMDNTQAPALPAHRVIVRGMAFMGGVEIKN